MIPKPIELAAGAAPRILLVEDHSGTAEALRHELSAFPVTVDWVASAAAALQCLKEWAGRGQTYSGALVDLTLPDQDGLALVHEAHLLSGLDALRVVLLVPLGQRLDQGLLRTVGVSAQLVKPVKQSRLRDVVRHLIQGDLPDPTDDTRFFSASSVQPASNRPLRLLLAEDNLVNQKVAGALLKKLGYRAEMVGNGRLVLDAVSRNEYDAILMDCQMPDLDGYQATRQLRRMEATGELGDRPPHYIIALTANAMAGDRERCLDAGMDDFLTKPLDEKLLASALQRASATVHAMPGQRPADSTPSVPGSNSMDDPALQDIPVLNEAELEKYRIPDDPSALNELIELFLEDLPSRFTDLRTAAARNDVAALRTAVHTLKGSASNMGASRLASVCRNLEEKLGKGDVIDLPSALPALEVEEAPLVATLKRWLPTAPAPLQSASQQ